jgi:MoxR-like ATPase
VFITGEAGIGKTALARHMAQHAVQRGVLVL